MKTKLQEFNVPTQDIIYLLANTTFPGSIEWSVDLANARDFETFKSNVEKKVEIAKKKFNAKKKLTGIKFEQKQIPKNG